MSEPLWSDDKINWQVDLSAASAAEAYRTKTMVRRVRDDMQARIAELEAQLANQYQRIERFVELVDQLERKLQEATGANTSCTIYIASQIERIGDLEAQLAQTWQPLPNGAYGASDDIIVAGQHLCMFVDGGDVGDNLPDNIRLCRLVESQPQPDWSSAPEWANWWTVDADGDTTFWQNKPEVLYLKCMWYDDGECETIGHTEPPIGIDWRTTLRQRPQEPTQDVEHDPGRYPYGEDNDE